AGSVSDLRAASLRSLTLPARHCVSASYPDSRASMTSEYLFPVLQTPPDFLAAAVAGTTRALTGRPARSAPANKPVTNGTAASTFPLDDAWGRLPDGMKFGLGCAVVVDSQDRVFVPSRSASPCVAIFGKDGKLLETWTKDFATNVGLTPQQVQATAHGLYHS